jgi:hypothetical protein
MFQLPTNSLPFSCELFLLGYVIHYRWFNGGKMDPKRMKAAIEVTRSKEMGSYKASRGFNVPQTILKRSTRVAPKVMPPISFHGNYNRCKENNITI